MQHDNDAPKYIGPFVTLNASDDGLLYTVAIEPPLPGCESGPRSFGSKSEAFGQGAAWWRLHGLPFKDFTDGNTGRDLWSENSEK